MSESFEIIFEILPGGPFGVPEPGRTILPGRAGTFHGDMIHTATMTRVGYGALSEYRSDDSAINQPVHIGSLEGSIRDNFLTVEVTAENHTAAFSSATAAVDRFLQHLSVGQNRLFEYRPLVIQSKEGRSYRGPFVGTLASVTHYHLDSLKLDIESSQRFCDLADERLFRAMGYFEHALFLFEKRAEVAPIMSRHFGYLIAAVFLNLWKAVTTIVGDPSRPKDGYQRRYRDLGFGEDFKARLDHLKTLRDAHDVAHPTLNKALLEQVEAAVGEAKNIAADVLRKYREQLQSTG